MSMIQVVHLSLGDFKQKPVIPTVQNDTNRVLKMIVDDFTLTDGMTGKLAFKRSDGTFCETAAEINLSDNSFSVVMDQALTQPGETLAQLKISNGTLVSSLGFIIFVEQDTSGVVTPQEGVSLEQAITQCEQIARQAQEILHTVEVITPTTMDIIDIANEVISENMDTTLTQSGKIADAKAVGDAIRELQESIAELRQAITQEG